MAYRVIGLTSEVYQGYSSRPGLEGPFWFSGRILYYDPKQGQYWDPRTDFYVSSDEMSCLRNEFVSTLEN